MLIMQIFMQRTHDSSIIFGLRYSEIFFSDLPGQGCQTYFYLELKTHAYPAGYEFMMLISPASVYPWKIFFSAGMEDYEEKDTVLVPDDYYYKLPPLPWYKNLFSLNSGSQ